MKTSNINIETRGGKNETIKLPGLFCFNRFSFLEEDQLTEDLENSVEELEIKECCGKKRENSKKPKNQKKSPKPEVTRKGIKNNKIKKMFCTEKQIKKFKQEKAIK